MNFLFFISFSIITFSGHENVVATLIELGARVDAEDELEETPLFNAAFGGNSV